MINKAYLGVQLAKMAVLFQANLNEEQTEIYLEELESLTQEQVDRAFKYLRQTWKPSAANPFPAICDILSACGASPDDGLSLAIATVKGAVSSFGSYVSVSFCDPTLHWVIKNIAGGWVELCAWEYKDWDINAGRLIEAYREAKLKGLDGGNHLSGTIERQNGWVTLRYIDVRNSTVKGKMEFRGEITDDAMDALDALNGCPQPESETQLIGNTIVAKVEAI